jgi:hypothetical protein
LVDLLEFGLPVASVSQHRQIFGVDQISQLNSDGFKTQLYHDQYSNKYILGFSGTELLNINDWQTNFNQFFGKEAEQYTRGVKLINNIRKDYINRVIVTGHSLGGGIATVAAIAGGLQCLAFNPPAIHTKTLRQFETLDLEEINQQITRYIVAGEILDLFNKTFSIKHKQIGTKQNLHGSWKIPNMLKFGLGQKVITRFFPHPIFIFASTIGTALFEKSITLHGMNEVIYGLKKYLKKTHNL